MAREDGFRLIEVSDDADDEVVIQAGAVPVALPDGPDVGAGVEAVAADAEGPADAADAAETAPPADAAAARAADLAEAAALAGVSEETAALFAEADDEARAELRAHLAAKRRRQEAQDMVTTAQDLHAKGPFRRMHIVVIVAFVLLVVAFGVYWGLTYGF